MISHRFAPQLLRFLTLFVLCATAIHATGADRIFTVRGIIRGPYEDGKIRIQHDEIPGFMPAMTMPFFVDAADVEELRPGDQVVFEFRVGERSKATKFRKVSDTPAPLPPAIAVPHGARPAVSQQRVREGDRVPEFELRDQDGARLALGDLKGEPTVVTFIFTRCPVPEFCPLIGKKFQELQRELARTAPDARLLSITIDPEHDQPEILRAYGESLGADFARWRFATGSPEEIGKLTKAFAVRTEREGGTLDHTLATALIGADGRVVQIWRGNFWKPAEVVERLGRLGTP